MNRLSEYYRQLESQGGADTEAKAAKRAYHEAKLMEMCQWNYRLGCDDGYACGWVHASLLVCGMMAAAAIARAVWW